MVQALSPIPAVWLGEIVLVVLGILIALQIDNWNDVRVDRYYSDLLFSMTTLKNTVAYLLANRTLTH